ncbi:ribosomal protein subunit S8 [Schizosaccharomyces japonicus yFS275]|uniref:Ribosomal protein subunit S8 n=1 Tax=Schizosaccharomyces japonicus (strain yFS275 / FY16936) TaxID=402676 RepID=B6K5W5_SCHJY|nr:ribosomal protein subunit S8 [Schizosaccharomyces japonicus yFS275]EEB08919.1 ribosomal protein subunit S8 [Schizosaccharomyces japonicus yFS275]
MQLIHSYSIIQNAFRAGFSMVKIPLTKSTLGLSLVLYKQGFISAVQRGSVFAPDEIEIPLTRQNISTRRLWLSLKYFEGKPVLQSIRAISKPSREVTLQFPALKKFATGYDVPSARGLEPGETAVVSTSRGILGLEDAISSGLGGMLLCRVK